MHHGFFAQALNKVKAHIRQRSLPVQPGFAFQLGNGVAQKIPLVFVKLQRLFDQDIALYQFGGRKANGQPGALGMVFDQVGHRMDAAMHRALLAVGGIAEINAARAFPVAGNVQRMIYQLVNALVFGGGNGHHGHTQQFLQLVYHHGTAVGAHFVHHVEGQHHGNAQLHQLHGEIQVALNVGGIHNVDDAVRVGVQKKIPGHDLLAGIGRKRVDAGQIGHRGLFMAADHAVLTVHRNAGEIAYMLVRAGKLIEQGGFAAVLVACQGKMQRLPLGDLSTQLAVTIAGGTVQFAHAGVGNGRMARFAALGTVGFVDVFHLDLCGVCQAQGKLVPAQLHFNGVAHGGHLAQRYLGARGKAHIQQMMAQFALAADGAQNSVLPYL